MSFDVEDVMKRAECPKCELVVEDYAPGVSSMMVDGLMYHPACVPASEGHASTVSAEYAREVHDLLTTGTTQTRPVTEHPLLNEAETDEMVEAFLLGVTAQAFAAKLELRDIALFEQSIDRETASLA